MLIYEYINYYLFIDPIIKKRRRSLEEDGEKEDDNPEGSL
jgi:hypothetical protein